MTQGHDIRRDSHQATTSSELEMRPDRGVPAAARTPSPVTSASGWS
jgi:hypothetical protein